MGIKLLAVRVVVHIGKTYKSADDITMIGKKV